MSNIGTNKVWKVAGISFDHMHMGDLLRLVSGHPQAEITPHVWNQPQSGSGFPMSVFLRIFAAVWKRLSLTLSFSAR